MSFADDFVARFEPWLTPDLEDYLRVIASMFSEVELLAFDVYDDDGEILYEGWTILFDPDRCPVKALPYLAQYVGERLPTGISEPAAREWIKDNPNAYRGTNYAIFRATQRTLTGDRTVFLKERDDGSGDDMPEHLLVRTLANDTPNEDAVLADLRSVVSIDTILHYDALAGQSWADAAVTADTWADAGALWPTWADAAAAVPTTGYTTFSRPRPL